MFIASKQASKQILCNLICIVMILSFFLNSISVYASSDEEKQSNVNTLKERNEQVLNGDVEDVPVLLRSGGVDLRAAYTVSKNGLDALTDYDFLVRADNMSLESAKVGTNSYFSKRISNILNFESTTLTSKDRYSNGVHRFNNISIPIRFSGCVDGSDGKVYDLIVTYTNIVVKISGAEGGGTRFSIVRDDAEGTWLCAYTNDSGICGVRASVNYKIVKAGTNTTVSGLVVAGYLDLDQADFGTDGFSGRGYTGGIANFQEGVRLVSGVSSNICLEPDTLLTVSNNNRDFCGTCNTNGPDSLKSGLSYLADASGWNITWSATYGGTRLTLNSEEVFEKYRVTPSREGPGSISPNFLQHVYKGQNRSFVCTPEEGAYIKFLSIDGREVSVTNKSGMTYTFSNVQANHTIHVVFDKLRYRVRYDDNNEFNPNHQTGESTQNIVTSVSGMPDSVYTYGVTGSLRMSDFVRDGYEFVGWNTKADGSGTSYADGYGSVLNWSSEPDDVITLYAQWRKKLGTETITVVSEETGNPVLNVKMKLQKKVNGVWKDIQNSVTGADGEIVINDLHWFDYRWVMTEVPAGYVKSSDTVFTITYNQLSATNQVVLYMKRVSVVLDSRVSDIIHGEAAPSFMYMISGTDVAGVQHSYNLMVQTSGSSKFGTNRLDDLFAGTYKVTQVPVSRYVAENTQNVRNSTPDGVNAGVDVVDNDIAEVLFPYTLHQYGGFSHTDGVTNKLEK